MRCTPAPFCGDGALEGDEQCDDGSNVGGDGCSAVCSVEIGWMCTGEPSICTGICGDGVILGGEECDDNNNDDGDGCSAACQIEQPQSKDQRKCINALNKNLAKVAKAQGKSICDCIKDFAKGESLTPAATLEECLTADRKGKVAKARGKTESDEAKKCAGILPAFGATDASTVNNAAVQKELNLVHAVFGSDLNVVIATETIAVDKPRSKCQQAVAKSVKRCQDTKLKEFNKCKKFSLKLGADDSTDLEACMLGSEAGKIAKACNPTTGKIRSTIDKKCGGVDFPGAFPQVIAIPGCGTDDPALLATCLDQIVECQVCLALNQADALARDCDNFDDGMANGSCP